MTALAISRLAPSEAMALIERVAGNRPLAVNIRQDIVERADGIPLFVEEMTKAVLEAEDEGAAERTVAAVPSPALAVPAISFQARSLAGRRLWRSAARAPPSAARPHRRSD